MLSIDEITIARNHLLRCCALPNPGRVVADIVAELAAHDLRMAVPAVCLIRPVEHPGKGGFALPGDHVIYVRVHDKCACEIAETAAHECRHRWQFLNGRFDQMLGKGQTEPDAERYARDFVERYEIKRRCACRRKPAIVYPINFLKRSETRWQSK
jgi:hypothetical protein